MAISSQNVAPYVPGTPSGNNSKTTPDYALPGGNSKTTPGYMVPEWRAPQAAPAPGAAPGEQSFVMPTYGGWSNLDAGARGQRLGQVGQMSFTGPATPEARAAIDNSLGGALRPQVGNTVGGGAGDPMIAEPGGGPAMPAPPPRPGLPQGFALSQQPGPQLSPVGTAPSVNSSLWRFSQGQGRF